MTVPVLCALSLLGGAVLAGPAGADGLAPPTITSSDATAFAVGQADSFTVTTTPGNDENGDGQVTLSESGPLPDDVTFTDNGDGTAALAGTPPDGTEGTYPVTITASNGVEPDATQDFTLSITDGRTDHRVGRRTQFHQRRRFIRRNGVGAWCSAAAHATAWFPGRRRGSVSTPTPGTSPVRHPPGQRASIIR